jgi:tRNA pseudouridine55 synthase
MRIAIYKKEGELLSELIDRVRILYTITSSVPVTYAGRLDPLASGVVILLTGQDVHHKDSITSLSKTYLLTVCIGVATDTGDCLGLVTQSRLFGDVVDFEAMAPLLVGPHIAPYPLYSSKTVAGVPLFVYAQKGIPVTPPLQKGVVLSCVYVGRESMTTAVVATQAIRRVQSVGGDFRQDSIVSEWEEWARQYVGKSWELVTFEVTATSGTYMRTLASVIGQRVGAPAFAWRITRTSVGDYMVGDGESLWYDA